MSKYSGLVVAYGATAYYRCGEASGQLVDAIAANNSTTATALTYSVAGALTEDADTAVTFNGTTSEVVIPAASGLNGGDTFSLVFWVKRSATQGTTQVIVDKGATGGDAWACYFATTNKVTFTDSNTGAAIATITSAITAQTYQMCAWTKATSTSHSYLNGVANETIGTNQTLADSTNALRFGWDWTGANFYSGTVDELAFFGGVVLTPAQILNLYAYGTSHIPLRPYPPIYPLLGQ